MAYNYPEYLVPVVGYAMQMLGRGESTSDLAARIANHDNFGFLSDEEIALAINNAIINNNATNAGRQNLPGQQIHTMFGGNFEQGGTIGVRVKVIMQDSNGLQRETTVLVNTNGNETLYQIFQFAMNLLQTPGSALYRTSESRIGEVVDMSLISLFNGGFNRGITFTE